MSGPPAPDPYFKAIEEEFLRRRKAPLLLSPRDWALIDEWKTAGVPLRIVLQGIANVFEAYAVRAPSGRRINALAYCRQEVAALHQMWLGLQAAGAGRPAPDASAAPGLEPFLRHLGRLRRRVRAAMAAASEARRDALVGALASAAAEIKRIRDELRAGEGGVRDLEERLRALDAELVEAARRSLPEPVLRDAAAAIERSLADRGGRPAGPLETTRALALDRAIRDAAGLPRLTLFEG